MNSSPVPDRFSLAGQVAVVTGGGGVLARAMCCELARRGMKVAVATRTAASAAPVVAAIAADGGEALDLRMDVTDAASVATATTTVLDHWGRVDLLVNAAGGNQPGAVAAPGQPFFDLAPEALRSVMELNWMGTVLPCQAFGRAMATRESGTIINISSMAAQRPLTRIAGYASAKAAIDNLTRWLAVHVAQTLTPHIRVNAIAPGFFETEQNRALLRDPATGTLSPRGDSILAHTPAARFGTPDDLLGALVWLASPASAFVTGIVVPVDGGFSAFAGV
jgi:NAD(P)-dependent dehydrogenase (short-subunit alcohol dehydrogenase family)